MIVRPRPSLLDLLFTLRGSIVPLIALRLAAVAAISVGVTALRAWRPGLLPDTPVAPFTLVSLALSIRGRLRVSSGSVKAPARRPRRATRRNPPDSA